MAATALAACSSGAASSAATHAPTLNPSETYNITYWSWTKGSQEAVNAFNAAHPKIHVTFEQIPSGSSGGYAKLQDAFKAGNGPDVFNVEYPELPEFVASGQVADITDYMTAKERDMYLPQAIDLTTLGGKNWAVPYDLGVQVLYYRSDLFTKYGLEVPKTWAQFRSDAEKLKTADPGVYMSNYVVDDPATLAALAWQAGAQWFGTSGDSWKVDFTDAQSMKVASFWQSMISDGLVAKVPSNGQGQIADWANGKVLTNISASWEAAYIPGTLPKQAGKWAAVPMPSFTGDAASGMNGGSSYAISKASKNKAADFEFAQWMTTQTKAIEPRVTGGGSSPYLSNANAESVAKKNFTSTYYGTQDLYKVFAASAAGLKHWTWGPTMTGTNTAMSDAAKGLTDGSITVDGVLKAGQADAIKEMKAMHLSVQ